MKNLMVFAFFLCLLLSCGQRREIFHTDRFFPVHPDLETDAVKNPDDAADDPAIWINPEDSSKSLLICTNKKSGIVVYNLEGREVGFYSVGQINNIDVRQGIYLTDSIEIDIAAGSNRTDQTIAVMRIRTDGTLENIAARKIFSGFPEVYGFCLYHDPDRRNLNAIVTSANLGPSFPTGLFVAQDGVNSQKDIIGNQNFKIISWKKITDNLNLE